MRINRLWLLVLRVTTFLPMFIVLSVLLFVVWLTQGRLDWYVVLIYFGLLVLAGVFVMKWKVLIGMATETED